MEGQKEQFLEAFGEYSDAIFRHCYFRVSDRERALEITQDTFMKTWDYISKGGSVNNFRPFLYKTLSNLIIDEYRKKKPVSLDQILEDESVFDSLGMGTEGRDEIERKLDTKQIVNELQGLPSHYRQVVIMRYIDELSPKEISQIIGESENIISVRIHRGLAWLRKNIAYE